jgi:hypothetical protein
MLLGIHDDAHVPSPHDQVARMCESDSQRRCSAIKVQGTGIGISVSRVLNMD